MFSRTVKRFFATVVIPPRRGSVHFTKWLALRLTLLLSALLLIFDYLVPILGNIYIPPRRSHLPKTPYGLSLVDTLPASLPSAVDVVFVHGLGSFPDTTWRKRRPNKADNKAVTSDVSWIRDLLPIDIPPARLLYFNYDSTTYNDAPVKMLDDIADELLLAFTQQSVRTTEEELNRPIIFLCHSYGGLVVKEALIRAKLAPERNSDILANTYGILFLGTPHRGTQYAGYARAVASRLNRLDSNPDIFLPLEVNSTQLEAQHDTFLWHYEGHLTMINFYETHKLEIYRTWIYNWAYRIMIVEKVSATFEAANTTNLLLDTDHSGLNKFDSQDDYNYTRVLRALRYMIRNIITDRQNRRLAEEAEEASQRKAAKQQSYAEACPSTKHYIVHSQTASSYTRRHSLMDQLASLMEETDKIRSPPRSVALWGPGGAGKSQLALRYAEENRNRYDPIIWVDASTPASAIKSYTNAFRDLKLDYPLHLMDERYKEATLGGRYLSMLQEDWVIPTVTQWLESRSTEHCEWLVIIDNADDVYWVQDLIPRGPRGSIIITSRDMLVKEYVSHALEIDRMTIDESIELLLHGIGPAKSPNDTHHSSGPDYMLLQQQALPIVEEFGRSALLLDLANRYISKHPHVYENISRYLDYHEEISFALLNNTQLDIQSRYRFTLATVYETSLAAVNNMSANSAAMLSLYAFLNEGIVEDRLFHEAAQSLAEERKYHSTWRPFLIWLQIVLFTWGPRLIIIILLKMCPWTPKLKGQTRITARHIVTVFPIIADALYLFIVLLVERSRVVSGDVITPHHLLAPYSIITLIYCSISYTIPIFSQWLFQEEKLPWTLSILPLIYATSVLMGWCWAMFYYGLDNTLEHHIKALLDRLDLSRISMTQFEKALVGLHDLSREQLGVTFPLQLSWIIFWKTICDIILTWLGLAIMFSWNAICETIISRLQNIQYRPRCLNILSWCFRLISTPTGLLFCIMAGYGIGRTGIISWQPWRTYYVPEGWISPDLLNSLLSTDSHGLWQSRIFDETMAPLVQYGLLHRSPNLGYTMHPLIQWWARQRLEPAMRAAWVAEAARFIELVYHSKRCFKDIFCQQMVIPHLIEIAGADVVNDGTQYWRLKYLLEMLYRSLSMLGRI